MQAHSLTTEYSTTGVQKILYGFASLGKAHNICQSNDDIDEEHTNNNIEQDVENIDIDINFLEDSDIDINFLENIDMNKGILLKININKILYR